MKILQPINDGHRNTEHAAATFKQATVEHATATFEHATATFEDETMETNLRLELEAFESVCGNEIFARVRAMYPALGLCLRPLTDSVPFARLATQALDHLPLDQKVRGAYLVRVFQSRMQPEVEAIWRAWLERNPDLHADPASVLTFFHTDRDYVQDVCEDEVATALGMRRGGDLEKLMQLWQYGIG